MDTQSVRSLILTSPLREQAVTVPAWTGTNLIIRELSAKDGSDLVDGSTDSTGETNQTSLIAGVVIATLRNADDPDKALIFQPTDRDALMATGLGAVMDVATKSITFSGLDAAAGTEAKNA